MTVLRGQSDAERAAYIDNLKKTRDERRAESAQADAELVDLVYKANALDPNEYETIKKKLEDAVAKSEEARRAQNKIYEVVGEFTAQTGQQIGPAS